MYAHFIAKLNMLLKIFDLVLCFLYQFAESSQKKEALQKNIEKLKTGREDTVSCFGGR